MRSKYRTTLLALTATLAFGALAAASASATLPEFKPHGTKEAPVSFTMSGSDVTYNVGIFTFPCSSSTGTGSITSAKGGTVKLTFRGCKVYNGRSCSTKEGGEIVTETLPFALVYTKKEPTKEVAIDFNQKGETFTTFYCSSVKAVVRHEILAPITALNTLTKSFTVKFNAPEGKQQPRENYTENLGGMEKSFPELNWAEDGFTQSFSVSTADQLSEFKQSGEKIEEKIEA